MVINENIWFLLRISALGVLEKQKLPTIQLQRLVTLIPKGPTYENPDHNSKYLNLIRMFPHNQFIYIIYSYSMFYVELKK